MIPPHWMAVRCASLAAAACQPSLSQPLAELRQAGLAAAQRESRAVFYPLAGESQRCFVAALPSGLGGDVAPIPAMSSRQRSRQAAVFTTVETLE